MIYKIKKILNKKNKSKIICLTSYSKNVAEAIDPYSDIILVGDSLGSTLYNYSTTRKVTLDQMIEHSKSARLGIKRKSNACGFTSTNERRVCNYSGICGLDVVVIYTSISPI